MKCKKCGKDKISCLGLCQSCYNKYYYVLTRYNMGFKDFIKTDFSTRYTNENIPHQKFEDHYMQFIKSYTLGEKQSKTKLAKDLGISRETLYKYIKIYNGGQNEKKGKI